MLEKEAREKEMELQEEWYEDLMDVSRIEWFGMYMNAYCETFDPHTSCWRLSKTRTLS